MLACFSVYNAGMFSVVNNAGVLSVVYTSDAFTFSVVYNAGTFLVMHNAGTFSVMYNAGTFSSQNFAFQETILYMCMHVVDKKVASWSVCVQSTRSEAKVV